MGKSKIAVAVSMGSVLMLSSGCANFSQTMKENAGKIGGVVLGAGAGYLACDGDPACVAAGLVGGLVLGDLYDKRQEQLRKLAKEKNIALETRTVKTFNSDEENGLELAINEGGMFELGSAELKTRSRLDLMSVATVYREQTQKILVIGHTDATGSDAYNQTLSEKRARSVAKLFKEVGVPADQIYFQGAGESQPVATNDTLEGRSTNRRVEIVEIDSEESLSAYNLQRQNDSKYLAHSNRTTEEKAEIRKRVKSAPEPKPVEKPEVAEKVPEPKPTPSSMAMLDFGGVPASSDFSQIKQAAGPASEDNGISFSLFSEAVANEPADLSPCYMEAPRVTGDIQNLASGKKLKASDLEMADYWPGLNGSVWYDGNVNGHGIGYVDLVVGRDTGIPKGRPTVKIYENVKSENTPDFVDQPHIETYPGEKGLLLRTYFDENHPVECMDVVMANGPSRSAKAGVLYYASGETIYEKNINLTRIR
ncbi:OmpA family protein [Marinobacter halotolerans]|uniref:OmpA family protein n=1 Tax=Marinobacter halotolerans TaxID=1569211 RepID=UPI0012463613|nr:OmpA family protein [Marinobacter halotolerans]